MYTKSLIVISALLLITGCSESLDKEDPTTATNILGAWEKPCKENILGSSQVIYVFTKDELDVQNALYSELACDKNTTIDKTHTKYKYSLGPKTVGSDGKEADELDLYYKALYAEYTMVRVIDSSTKLTIAGRGEDDNATGEGGFLTDGNVTNPSPTENNETNARKNIFTSAGTFYREGVVPDENSSL